MKLLLKLFLILCLVLAGIYAATPLWLSHILARQLPPGWQLQEMESGYPGLGGINIGLLRVNGELGPAEIALTSSDLRFTYQGLKTDIGQLGVDIFLQASSTRPADGLSLDDLSLPVTNLTGQLPQLSIDRAVVRIHKESGLPGVAGRPLQLGFDAFELTPRSNDSFQLTGEVRIAESLRFSDQLEVDVSPELIDAVIRFPSSNGPSPWLLVAMKQEKKQADTATRLDVVLNADLANREWLDSILAGATGYELTQLGGKLEVHGFFAGRVLQGIERLSLKTEDLLLMSDSGTLDLSTELLVHRDGEKLAVTLPTTASIHYQGKTVWIDEVLGETFPALQLSPRPETSIETKISSDSGLTLLTGSNPSASFKGDIDIKLQSDAQTLNLQSTGLQLEMANLKAPASATAEGLVKLDLNMNTPFSYHSGSLHLDAKALSAKADLTVSDGTFFSTGSATTIDARMTPGAISTDKTEIAWKEVDLAKLTGTLEVGTQGFTMQGLPMQDLPTEPGQETWSGFDFDVKIKLLSETDSSGSGTMNFVSGPAIPFEFSGNTGLERWVIQLPPSSIQLRDLKKMLLTVHQDIPSSVTLTSGSIELQGEIMVEDETSANLIISGHEAGASMSKSNARDASFTLKTVWDKTLLVAGPVSIKAFTLAGGVEVANIEAGLKFEDDEHFELENIYAEAFDGQLELGNLQYSEGSIANTTIELRHINLEKVLAYADIDGLEGTGFLDISLPVGSDQTGIYIKDGIFYSTGAGRLAYTKEGVAGSNIGLQALENFQYKELSGSLNYQSNGEYLITIRLDGKNPDLYGGHPVVFNLNINGSLPALFEAMFITGSFEESILKQIKSQ